MKLQFKHQQFQSDAADAVCEVFAGQPFSESRYTVDTGVSDGRFKETDSVVGWNNLPVKLSDEAVLANLQRVQRRFNLVPSMGKAATTLRSRWRRGSARRTRISRRCTNCTSGTGGGNLS